MYRRIVLAVDPDGLAESVLPVLATLARRSGGDVFIVGAAKSSEAQGLREALGKHVQEAADELTAAGINVHGEVRQVREESSVAEVIVSACHEYAADLVALGSHGRGSLAALIEGSVGRQALTHLDVPALLVHSRVAGHVNVVPTPLGRILVPVDFSEASRQSVKIAEDLALEHRATVMILHVREMVPWGDLPYIEPSAEGQELVTSLADEMRRKGVTTEAQVKDPEVNPASAIVKTADDWNADLIVIGSRRLTPVGGLFLGSVAQAIIRRTIRPVLLSGHPAHEPQRSSLPRG